MLLLSIQEIFDNIIAKLKEEVFVIAEFSVKLWMIVTLAALLLIVILIIIVASVKKAKKKKRIASSTEIENTDEPLETVSIVSEETIDHSENTETTDATVEETADEPTTDSSSSTTTTKKTTTRRRKTSTTSTSTRKTTRTKKDTKVDVVDEAPTSETSDDSSDETKKIRPRVYHVSMREDGKWQVKFAKGVRAIKTFATQLEAIDYAKKLAVTQKGSIMIHKKDGKIRKLKY